MSARRAGRRGASWCATAALPSAPGRARSSAGKLASQLHAQLLSPAEIKPTTPPLHLLACQGSRLGRRERACRHARRRSSCCGAACAAAASQLGAATRNAAAPACADTPRPAFRVQRACAAARPQGCADGLRACAPAPDSSCGSSRRLAAAMGGSGGYRVRMPRHRRLARAGTVAAACPALSIALSQPATPRLRMAAHLPQDLLPERGALRVRRRTPAERRGAPRARRRAKRRHAGAVSAHRAQRLRAMVGEQSMEQPCLVRAQALQPGSPRRCLVARTTLRWTGGHWRASAPRT
jgi:hypothetical protein